MNSVITIVTRGPITESCHYGHIAVTDVEGNILWSYGDPTRVTYIRSAAKPLQVLPLVESGAADQFGFTEKEIAIMTGSHSGEADHTETILAILDKIDLNTSDLQCGIHPPTHRPTAQKIKEQGERPSELHNNCSGKHAGMLALAKFHGWPLDNYLDIDHPVQQTCLQVNSDLCGISSHAVHIGIDGCGVPVFGMPLHTMARAYALLASPNNLSPQRQKALKMISQSMLNHPRMVAGTGRIDTDLMTIASKKVIAKIGAEAVHCMGIPHLGLGIAIKADDGALRGLEPAVIEVLAQLDILSDLELEKLKTYHTPVTLNHRKEVVGTIRPVFKLQKHVN